MKKINDNFLNSIRIIKLYGDLPKKAFAESPKDYEKRIKKMLAVWTSTSVGISCRGNKLPIPEFSLFSFK